MPSLDALRAFEVAARHLSFTKAAAELHVTQSALSHRIRDLEDELGRKLFRRATRAMTLTQDGVMLAEGVRRGVGEIARALAGLDRDEGHRVVVTTLPSFAQRWLVPRLPRFRHLHPAIEIRVVATSALADFAARAVDVGIRFGAGRYPGLAVTKLMADTVFPVVSPRLLAQLGPIERPRDIVRYPLLLDAAAEVDASGSGWASWIAHANAGLELDHVAFREGLRLDQANLVLDAAVNGLGVALARRSLAADDLAASRLVRLLPHEAPTAFTYWLVSLPDRRDDPAVGAFCDWLLAEAVPRAARVERAA